MGRINVQESSRISYFLVNVSLSWLLPCFFLGVVPCIQMVPHVPKTQERQALAARMF